MSESMNGERKGRSPVVKTGTNSNSADSSSRGDGSSSNVDPANLHAHNYAQQHAHDHDSTYSRIPHLGTWRLGNQLPDGPVLKRPPTLVQPIETPRTEGYLAANLLSNGNVMSRENSLSVLKTAQQNELTGTTSVSVSVSPLRTGASERER